MRDPERIDKVMEALGEVWKRAPDWRFAQLFCNVQRMMGNDLFYLEDDKLVEAFTSFKDEYLK